MKKQVGNRMDVKTIKTIEMLKLEGFCKSSQEFITNAIDEKISKIFKENEYIKNEVTRRLKRDKKINKIKQEMIAEARKKHGHIFPCSSRTSLDDSFTQDMGELVLWYNDSNDGSWTIRRKL